jgi:hypothetical protein
MIILDIMPIGRNFYKYLISHTQNELLLGEIKVFWDIAEV